LDLTPKRERSPSVPAWRAAALLVLFVFGVLAAAGCSQSVNEDCQVSRDCASGLVCCISGQAARGFCGHAGTTECGGTASPSAGGDDAGTTDSGPNMSYADSGTSDDAGHGDGG
jgi:hypothetical protein